MEYQKRLRLIQYIKANYEVNEDEFIVFFYPDLDQIHLMTAVKIDLKKDEKRLGEVLRQQNGTCLVSNTCEKGPYIDFVDEYLSYQEHYVTGYCENNSLRASPVGFKLEIISEIDEMIRQLNGEEPTYYKSNC